MMKIKDKQRNTKDNTITPTNKLQPNKLLGSGAAWSLMIAFYK